MHAVRTRFIICPWALNKKDCRGRTDGRAHVWKWQLAQNDICFVPILSLMHACKKGCRSTQHVHAGGKLAMTYEKLGSGGKTRIMLHHARTYSSRFVEIYILVKHYQ